MGCSSSKQVQVSEASGGKERPIRGDLYVSWTSPPCRATFMTLAALGVKPNFKVLDLMKEEQKSPEFIAINPFHTVPTYVDGDFKLWESRAVIAYLVSEFGGSNNSLYPKDPQKRARIDAALNTDAGTFAKATSAWIGPQLFGNKDGVDIEKKLEELDDAYKALDEIFLGHNEYVAGDQMTIADFSVLATITTSELKDYDFSKFPNITAWMAKMKKLPYFEKCNKGHYEMKANLPA